MSETNDHARQAAVRLTPQECARLRPTVNVAALERFLTADPRVPRHAAIVHFARSVTYDDVVTFMRAVQAEGGGSTDLVAELEHALDADRAGSESVTPTPRSSSGGLEYFAVPHTQFIPQVDPPADPTLGELWAAIEPPR